MNYRLIGKGLSNLFIKEDETMTVNGISGTNTQAAQMGMNQAMDSYSKEHTHVDVRLWSLGKSPKYQKRNIRYRCG